MKETIERRLAELRGKLKLARLNEHLANSDTIIGRLEGNIGALEWVLRVLRDQE